MKALIAIILVHFSSALYAQWTAIENHPAHRFKTNVELWDQIITQGNFAMDTFEVFMPRYDFQCGVALRKQFIPGKYKFQIEIFTSMSPTRSGFTGAKVKFTDGTYLDYPDAKCLDYGTETINNYVLSARIDVSDNVARDIATKKISSVQIGRTTYYPLPSESKKLIRLNQIIWNRTNLKP